MAFQTGAPGSMLAVNMRLVDAVVRGTLFCVGGDDGLLA